MTKEKKKTETKEKFNFKEYITNLDLNKYLKIGFLETLEEEPKTLAQTEKLLKKYLGEQNHGNYTKNNRYPSG